MYAPIGETMLDEDPLYMYIFKTISIFSGKNWFRWMLWKILWRYQFPSQLGHYENLGVLYCAKKGKKSPFITLGWGNKHSSEVRFWSIAITHKYFHKNFCLQIYVCPGDSGGPTIWEDKRDQKFPDRAYLIGIIQGSSTYQMRNQRCHSDIQ